MEEFKQVTGQVELPEDAISINWHKWQPKILPYAVLSNKSSIKDLLMQRQNDIPNGKVILLILLLIFQLGIMQFSLECLGALSFQVLCRLLNVKCKGSEKYFLDFLEVSVIKIVMLIMYIIILYV